MILPHELAVLSRRALGVASELGISTIAESNPFSHALLLNRQQTAEIRRFTVAEGTTALALMENAGKAVATEIQRRWTLRPVLVLCGPGDNGGDGFVAARHLFDAGWPVRVALLGAPEELKGEARHHAGRWRGTIELLAPAVVDGASLIVDALFGSGLSGQIEGPAAETLAAAARSGCPIIAVDLPSGVTADGGETLGAVATALTVTFFRKKPGHVLQPGRMLCGEVVVADIGISVRVLQRVLTATFENDPTLWRTELPRAHATGNKYSRGHAMIFGGYPMTGAARMAARAAARIGAGLTTVVVPEIAMSIYGSALTSTLVHPLAGPADFDRLMSECHFSALLIGPGAGVGESTRGRVLAMLATGGRRYSMPT